MDRKLRHDTIEVLGEALSLICDHYGRNGCNCGGDGCDSSCTASKVRRVIAALEEEQRAGLLGWALGWLGRL